jgi:hypothetical protein
MRIANGKDFWAGVMFIAFGLGFMYVSQNYPMGTAVRMGPAYFPTVLGGILAVLGAAVFFRAFVSKIEAPLRVFPFRAWPLVAGIVLGVVALYTQTSRESGIGWEVSHMILSGIAIVLMFAAFGPKPLWVVLSAVVLFGYLLKPIGVVPAIFVLIVISALPGFTWTRKDYVMVPAYVAGGLVLTYLTLLVSPWVTRAVVAAFGAIGVSLSATLTLILTEMVLGGVLGYLGGRYKWPHVTAAQVTILSYALAVFSVAAFIHGLGLPINIWPSIWE